MALTTPMPYEMVALGQMIVKAIKELPPEAQPPAVVLAVEAVKALEAAADAFVNALPGWPPSLSHKEIKKNAATLEAFYVKAPPTSPLSIFEPGVNMIREVEGMVDPLGDDPPTIPHKLLAPFIDRQAGMLIDYIEKNVLK